MGSITDLANTSLAEPFWVLSDFLWAAGSHDLSDTFWDIAADLSDSF
ncbi:hypothetical protein [Tomitella cavernea]|uniref:Uncharacterized protein n=1 Tax=Tomitella cavernea TaxID=1387982 RepID=A0ABP9C9C1_9ACTN|nr:hypothetical protein [Tomitella cavernea]